MTMSPETVTQLRRRLAAFFLCFGLIAVHQPGSTRAQSDDVIADPESYAVFAAAFTIGIADSGRPADRVALLGETRAVTTCPDEKAVPPEWRPVVASHTKENASIRTFAARRGPGTAILLGEPVLPRVSAAHVREA